MAVVLITGCNGFIGRATARALAALGHKVIGIDEEAPRTVAPLAEFVPADLTDDASVEGAVGHVGRGHGREFGAVIHLASYADFSGEPSPLYEAVTVRGTERLLRCLEPCDVARFVFSSTMLVHAPTDPGFRINEASPIEPEWDYPKSKWQAEELIRRVTRIPHAILRIASVYDDGCHSPPLAHQIQRIFERQLVSYVFPGNPSRGQAYVHLDDLVDVFVRIADGRAELRAAETFLIGEPETVNYDELQRGIGLLLHGEEWTTRSIPKALAKAGAWLEEQLPGEEPFIKPWMIDGADDHFELDIKQARKRLGWNPVRSLRMALPELIAVLQADPVWWYRENNLELPGWLEGRADGEAAAHPPVTRA